MKMIVATITLAFCILTTLGLAACAQPDEQEPNSDLVPDLSLDLPGISGGAMDMTFELATTDVPKHDKMTVYKVQTPVVTAESVKRIGKELGFDGDAGSIEPEAQIAMIARNGEEIRSLRVWISSGAVYYGFAQPDKLYPETRPDLPSAEEAKRIAIEFCNKAGLLPADAAVDKIEVRDGGTFAIMSRETEDPLEEHATHLLVIIPRYIDGFPVVGLSTGISARIGDKGEVVQVEKSWREIEPYKNMKIKSTKQAYEGLTLEGSRMALGWAAKVVINEVSLAYWMEAAHVKQEYVVPVYVFKGDALDEQGNVIEPFEGWIEALEGY